GCPSSVASGGLGVGGRPTGGVGWAAASLVPAGGGWPGRRSEKGGDGGDDFAAVDVHVLVGQVEGVQHLLDGHGRDVGDAGDVDDGGGQVGEQYAVAVGDVAEVGADGAGAGGVGVEGVDQAGGCGVRVHAPHRITLCDTCATIRR